MQEQVIPPISIFSMYCFTFVACAYFVYYISLAFCQELLSPCFKTGEWETQTQHHFGVPQSNPASQPATKLFANGPRMRCTLHWPPPYPQQQSQPQRNQKLPKLKSAPPSSILKNVPAASPMFGVRRPTLSTTLFHFQRLMLSRSDWKSAEDFSQVPNKDSKSCLSFPRLSNQTLPDSPITPSKSNFLPTLTRSLYPTSVPFHPPLEVLFIFRSHYLFAIGFSSIFSVTWDLPRTLGCNPKQPDS